MKYSYEYKYGTGNWVLSAHAGTTLTKAIDKALGFRDRIQHSGIDGIRLRVVTVVYESNAWKRVDVMEEI